MGIHLTQAFKEILRSNYASSFPVKLIYGIRNKQMPLLTMGRGSEILSYSAKENVNSMSFQDGSRAVGTQSCRAWPPAP